MNNSSTTLIVQQELEERNNMDYFEFCNYIKDSDKHIESISKEFMRQLARFKPEYDIRDEYKLVDFLCNKLKEKSLGWRNHRQSLEFLLRIRDKKTSDGKLIKQPGLSEENIYKLCFALELNEKDTLDLFQKAFGLRGYNFRVINDIVYYHCLATNKTHQLATEFLRECYSLFSDISTSTDPDNAIGFETTEHFEANVRSQLEKINWYDKEDVASWLKANRHNFLGYSRTAALRYMEIVNELRLNIIHCLIIFDAGPAGDAFSERGFRAHVLDNLQNKLKGLIKALKDSNDWKDKRLCSSLELYMNSHTDAYRGRAWDKICQELSEYFIIDTNYDPSDSAFEDVYSVTSRKFEFIRPLLTPFYLFWRLFDVNVFSRDYTTDTRKGLPNYLAKTIWLSIDENPKRLTWRPQTYTFYEPDGRVEEKITVDRIITDPDSAREWPRVDAVGRRILILAFYYKEITGCVRNDSIPNDFGKLFYDKINSLLKGCGYQPLYERNRFDSLIIASVNNFKTEFATCPCEYRFSDTFIDPVLETAPELFE